MNRFTAEQQDFHDKLAALDIDLDFDAEEEIYDPWESGNDTFPVSVYRGWISSKLLSAIAVFEKLQMPARAAGNHYFDPGWLLIDLMEETFYQSNDVTSDEMEDMFLESWILLNAAGLITPMSLQNHARRLKYPYSWSAIMGIFNDADELDRQRRENE